VKFGGTSAGVRASAERSVVDAAGVAVAAGPAEVPVPVQPAASRTAQIVRESVTQEMTFIGKNRAMVV
jgi:hypothetical protein